MFVAVGFILFEVEVFHRQTLWKILVYDVYDCIFVILFSDSDPVLSFLKL